jgi:oligopeptide transport system permease protein
MTTYLLRRILWMIPVLLLVALITFVMMHQAPGGPWDRDLSRRQVDAATQEALNKKFGLDKPLFINLEGGNPLDSQFFTYVGNAIQGDLGPSYRQRGRDVQDILFEPAKGKPFWDSRFGYSMRLGILALMLAALAGIPLGILAALKRNTIFDYSALFVSTIGISVPSFVLAIFLIIVLAGQLNILKIIQRDWSNPAAWSVPAIVLGFGTFAYITRLTRNSMLEVMGQDYVRTAQRQGAGRARHHHAAHAAQRPDPGDDDHGAGAGGLDHRLLHHRDHVRFSGQRARIRDGDQQPRLLHDHGYDADLCVAHRPGQPDGRHHLRVP